MLRSTFLCHVRKKRFLCFSFLCKLFFQYVLNPELSLNELYTKSQRCKMCQGLLKVIYSLSNNECFHYSMCILTSHMFDWLYVNISLGWVSLRSLSEGLMTPQLRFTEISLNTPISQVIKRGLETCDTPHTALNTSIFIVRQRDKWQQTDYKDRA